MVPSPTWTPPAASLAVRSAPSARPRAATASPSRMIALMVVLSSSLPRPGGPSNSVPEVALAGRHQRDGALVGRLDHRRVADRPARMDHRGDPGPGEPLQPVGEREERVAGAGTALGPVPRLGHRDLGRADP